MIQCALIQTHTYQRCLLAEMLCNMDSVGCIVYDTLAAAYLTLVTVNTVLKFIIKFKIQVQVVEVEVMCTDLHF
jgi:hypothetical protein